MRVKLHKHDDHHHRHHGRTHADTTAHDEGDVQEISHGPALPPSTPSRAIVTAHSGQLSHKVPVFAQGLIESDVRWRSELPPCACRATDPSLAFFTPRAQEFEYYIELLNAPIRDLNDGMENAGLFGAMCWYCIWQPRMNETIRAVHQEIRAINAVLTKKRSLLRFGHESHIDFIWVRSTPRVVLLVAGARVLEPGLTWACVGERAARHPRQLTGQELSVSACIASCGGQDRARKAAD